MDNKQSLPSGMPTDPVEQILAHRKAFETAVTLRAWSDTAFAEQLAQDPVAAINAAFGVELPTDLDIQLHHESPTTLHLALPPMPIIPANSNELTEDDLERVAGGASFVVSMSVTSATLVTTAVTLSATVSAAASAVATAVINKD